nr:hypothetical protein [uncultured Arsenicibacter sp.]
MKRITTNAFYALAIGMLMTACTNRPYATLQRTPAEVATTRSVATAPVVAEQTVSQAGIQPVTVPVTVTEAAPQTVNEALAKYEAVASADNKLSVSDKQKLDKRMGRIRQLLATTSLTEASAGAATHKATAMERMMVKKINKKIQQKMSPEKTQKAQLNTGVLTGGAVLVILGLLLLLLTSGTAATLGLVSLIVGAVLLLIGLL